jgi:hypothetical protein
MLNYGKSNVRMLIIAGQLRSINNGRSPRILPRRLRIADICRESSASTKRGRSTSGSPSSVRTPKRPAYPNVSGWSIASLRLTIVASRAPTRGVNVVHRGWRFRLSNEEMNVIRLALLLRAVCLLAAVRRLRHGTDDHDRLLRCRLLMASAYVASRQHGAEP